ncbi:MAG TPA: sensor histidine kinase [Roseiarcus sp.]|nr:sensor histidine kinase [Roseiarcus sp.]
MRPQGIEANAPRAGRQELLNREILEIVDGERQRLGRELHDGLCQSLAGIAALSSALSRSLAASGQPGPAAAAGEIVRLLDETIGEARDLAHGLSPIGLNGAGLAVGLEALARSVRHTHRISCALAPDSRFPSLRHETEAHLMRIAQEAVRNALAHGRADQIEISLACVDGSGMLRIRDNGVGLADDDRSHDGAGLQTMDYRARAIGGFLTVAGRPEGGTAVGCAFPLPRTPDPREGHGDAPAQS